MTQSLLKPDRCRSSVAFGQPECLTHRNTCVFHFGMCVCSLAELVYITSAAVFKIEFNFFLDPLMQEMNLYIMKVNSFRGDLTDCF